MSLLIRVKVRERIANREMSENGWTDSFESRMETGAESFYVTPKMGYPKWYEGLPFSLQNKEIEPLSYHETWLDFLEEPPHD